MDKTIAKIDNIKSLWQQLPNDGSKTEFIKLAAEDLGKSPNTIHNHWFARFWQVPEQYEDRVIELLQNTIRNNSGGK